MTKRRVVSVLLIAAWVLFAFSWTTPEPRAPNEGAALAGVVFVWLWILFWASVSLVNYSASDERKGCMALFERVARGLVMTAIMAVICGVFSVTARHRYGLTPPALTETLVGNLTLLGIYVTPSVVTVHFLVRKARMMAVR